MEQTQQLQAPVVPEVGDWFVLHVKPRQEKILAADLERRIIRSARDVNV